MSDEERDALRKQMSEVLLGAVRAAGKEIAPAGTMAELDRLRSESAALRGEVERLKARMAHNCQDAAADARAETLRQCADLVRAEVRWDEIASAMGLAPAAEKEEP